MLTCISSCSKHIGGGDGSLPPQQLHHDDDEDQTVAVPTPKHSIKALTSQIKDMALKPCKPCSGSSNRKPNAADDYDSSSISERFHCSYKRTAGSSADSTPRVWGKEMEARLKGLSSGQATPSSVSGRTDSVVMDDDDDDDEWVAQVEPGVLVTFASLPNGGNDLKRIRFSRDVFNKWQAQRWWAENYDKVMELYNVQRFNRQAVALPTPPRSEDESSKIESDESSPETPPLCTERKPRNLHHPNGKGSSSDSLDQHPMQSHRHNDSALASTPKLSSISGEKTEASSIDASARTSSYREGDRSGEVSFSNASDNESEWIEQDVPGVYITIRALPSGIRELRRVRFSREKFGEMQARLWWEENRGRIQEQYL